MLRVPPLVPPPASGPDREGPVGMKVTLRGALVSPQVGRRKAGLSIPLLALYFPVTRVSEPHGTPEFTK